MINCGALPQNVLAQYEKFYKHGGKSISNSVKGSIKGSEASGLEGNNVRC